MRRAGSLIGTIKFPPNMADQETRARSAWAVAVGKKILRYARASALVRTTLIVEVEDMVWQRQLTTMRPLLVHNLNEALGEPLVTDIDFRSVPARIMPRKAQSARPASSAQGIHDEADAIADPVMRMLYRKSAQAQSVVRGQGEKSAQAQSAVRGSVTTSAPAKKSAQAESAGRRGTKRSA